MRIINAHISSEGITMTQLYNQLAPKKPTNVSVNSELLIKARSLKLNLSATLEKALAREVKAAERLQWLEKNKNAIQAANNLAEEKGLFTNSYRTL